MLSFERVLPTILGCAISAFVIAGGSAAFGQDAGLKARGGAGSTATNELRNIYNNDVGQGYTTQSLNQISLANARAQVRNYGQASFNQPSRPVQSLAPTGAPKPFASVSSAPTVSPYLNLFREDLNGTGDLNYQTLVRPQLQQLATNQSFQRQNNELAQRVQSISAQGAFQNPAGSESQYPTGHQTLFNYHGRYYPGLQQRR